jgi:hypothetical protein
MMPIKHQLHRCVGSNNSKFFYIYLTWSQAKDNKNFDIKWSKYILDKTRLNTAEMKQFKASKNKV